MEAFLPYEMVKSCVVGLQHGNLASIPASRTVYLKHVYPGQARPLFAPGHISVSYVGRCPSMTQDLLQPQLSGWATCWMHVATELDTAQFASRRKPINKIQAFEDVFGRLESSSPSAQWAALLHTATIDLATARTIEPHLDALTILSEVWSTAPEPDTYWGVYAAEVPDSGLVAERSQGQTFELTGEKRWCSLATELTHAIVTAEVDDNRQAFAIHLQKPDVTHSEEVWNSEGLNEIPSGSIQCHNSPAKPVGEPGWYLERQGFWTGAI